MWLLAAEPEVILQTSRASCWLLHTDYLVCTLLATSLLAHQSKSFPRFSGCSSRSEGERSSSRRSSHCSLCRSWERSNHGLRKNRVESIPHCYRALPSSTVTNGSVDQTSTAPNSSGSIHKQSAGARGKYKPAERWFIRCGYRLRRIRRRTVQKPPSIPSNPSILG